MILGMSLSNPANQPSVYTDRSGCRRLLQFSFNTRLQLNGKNSRRGKTEKNAKQIKAEVKSHSLLKAEKKNSILD